MRLKLTTIALGSMLIAIPSVSFAVTLPNGTCTGEGMTVTVQGGKIVGYKFGGRSYSVSALSASKYRIGQAGTLAVRGAKERTFKGTFSFVNGFNTSATFRCK